MGTSRDRVFPENTNIHIPDFRQNWEYIVFTNNLRLLCTTKKLGIEPSPD